MYNKLTQISKSNTNISSIVDAKIVQKKIDQAKGQIIPAIMRATSTAHATEGNHSTSQKQLLGTTLASMRSSERQVPKKPLDLNNLIKITDQDKFKNNSEMRSAR